MPEHILYPVHSRVEGVERAVQEPHGQLARSLSVPATKVVNTSKQPAVTNAKFVGMNSAASTVSPCPVVTNTE